MAFSPQEIQFLTALKNQGVTKEQAMARLGRIRGGSQVPQLQEKRQVPTPQPSGISGQIAQTALGQVQPEQIQAPTLPIATGIDKEARARQAEQRLEQAGKEFKEKGLLGSALEGSDLLAKDVGKAVKVGREAVFDENWKAGMQILKNKAKGIGTGKPSVPIGIETPFGEIPIPERVAGFTAGIAPQIQQATGRVEQALKGEATGEFRGETGQLSTPRRLLETGAGFTQAVFAPIAGAFGATPEAGKAIKKIPELTFRGGVEINALADNLLEKTGVDLEDSFANLTPEEKDRIAKESAKVAGQGVKKGFDFFVKTTADITGQDENTVKNVIESTVLASPLAPKVFKTGVKTGKTILKTGKEIVKEAPGAFKTGVQVGKEFIKKEAPVIKKTIEKSFKDVEKFGDIIGKKTSKIIKSLAKKKDVDTLIGLKIPTQKSTIAGGVLQRMHKPLPKKAEDFAKIAKKPMGEWLVERGIIASPEKTVGRLFERFKQSKGQVDKGFSKIKGRFQAPVLTKINNELVKLESELAKKGATSKDIFLIRNLSKKLKKKGLDMTEINELKRLYERKVKTEFMKDSTKTGAEIQAKTNLDSKLREWQADKAKDLGFKDLSNLNKETMQTRLVLDAVGEKFLRAQSNNAISLTDWIVGAGASTSPGFLAGLVGKKLLSSERFMSGFAKVAGIGKKKIGAPKIESLEKISRLEKIKEAKKAVQDKIKKQKDLGKKSKK